MKREAELLSVKTHFFLLPTVRRMQVFLKLTVYFSLSPPSNLSSLTVPTE